MIWEAFADIQTARKNLHIRYFVTPPTIEKDSGAMCYGIGISDGETTCTVAAFCPEKEEAVQVAEMLHRMEVTPVTFYDVLEDYWILR